METNPDQHPSSTILDAGPDVGQAATATMERDAGEPDATVTDPMNADRNSQRPPWAPPAPPPPPRPRRSWIDVPIARDRTDGRIAGVVAGVSKAYGFDRRTTRLAVALGTLVIPGVIALVHRRDGSSCRAPARSRGRCGRSSPIAGGGR